MPLKLNVWLSCHDDVIKIRFPRHWSCVRGIHLSSVDSPERPVTQSFDAFFDMRLNKRLGKQSKCRWCQIVVQCCFHFSFAANRIDGIIAHWVALFISMSSWPCCRKNRAGQSVDSRVHSALWRSGPRIYLYDSIYSCTCIFFCIYI